jgi:low affinity Fe/Cu permease
VPSKTQEISAIENKYGLVLFRMGLTHLADVGIRHLTDENVNEAIKQIAANDEAEQAGGIVTIMTAEFQFKIVQCAAELAKFNIWELFAYIKNHVAISD